LLRLTSRYFPLKINPRIVIGLIVLPLVVFVVAALFKSGAPEKRVEWATPLSLEAARASPLGAQLALPDSAWDILAFNQKKGANQNLLYVRFQASPEDMDQYIESQSLQFRNNFPDDKISRSAITADSFRGIAWTLSVPTWWDTRDLTKGTYVRSASGRGPHFWIDPAKSTIYHYAFF